MIDSYQVWVDVGGTFTDCFVLAPNGKRFRGKVLSSGICKCAVDTLISQSIVTATNTSQLLDSLPDNFWNGASLAVTTRSGNVSSSVKQYQANGRSFQLKKPLVGSLSAGDLIELDAGLEAPVLAVRQLLGIGLKDPLPPLDVRLGTTRGTNALLTRTGAQAALVTTRGFGDVLRIGSQERPELFDLNIRKPKPLIDYVVELDERLDSNGNVLVALERCQVRKELQQIFDAGIRSLAISFLHSFQNNTHELIVEEIASAIGFTNISVASSLSKLIKFVSRTETAALDAYLNPILHSYINRIWTQFGGPDNTRLRLMTSGGQLVAGDAFRGSESVLSGPAGGVIALAAVGDALRATDICGHGVIGFDMGGTSTDVSRYQGHLVKQSESRKAGVRVMTPMMAINTVAAGGGSICHVENGRLIVGPQSAGSHPGPACYGNDGPLTVTDLNLILGRVVEDHFPFKLDTDAARLRLNSLRSELEKSGVLFESAEALAAGFLRIAVNHMAEAVRTVTTAEGSDPRELGLVSFGGAAGQHACTVADALDMQTVIDHPDASMFSALGMGLASVGRTASKGTYLKCESLSDIEVESLLRDLDAEGRQGLSTEVAPQSQVNTHAIAELRYLGTESSLTVQLPENPVFEDRCFVNQLVDRFQEAHQVGFGYKRLDRGVELVSLTVEVEVASSHTLQIEETELNKSLISTDKTQAVFFDGKWHDVCLVDRSKLRPGPPLIGPALIASSHNTLLLMPNWNARVCEDGTIIARKTGSKQFSNTLKDTKRQQEPVELEVTARRLEGIAEQMGEILRRTAISVNVKERLDYSCAVFNQDGFLIAGAMHVPVHLGAMGHTVRNLMRRFPEMYDGDCYLSNNPYAGGSHLPDVTVVSPVFVTQSSPKPDFFVASRAHHAEIGGMTPGSMPPSATRLSEEGVVIDAFPLIRDGKSFEDQLQNLLSMAEYPSRNPKENLADIAAQLAAGRRGANDLRALAIQQGIDTLQQRMSRLLDLSAESLADVIAEMNDSPHTFQDELVKGYAIRVTLQRKAERLSVDFTGTAQQHPGGWNATPAIVSAALLYVLRCLTTRPLPLCEGILEKIDLYIPQGLLNPVSASSIGDSPAVVAGNVETSQRVVDCLLGALGVAAASQGTMNNLLIGDSSFGYYETICGGAGATSEAAGADAVHTHMTNTRITDPEILETRYPMRLRKFQIRQDSGGVGKRRGGNGVVREIEFLKPLVVSMLSSRRGDCRPYGMNGGRSGSPGRNLLITGADQKDLGGSFSIDVTAGQILRIESPGGGGFG